MSFIKLSNYVQNNFPGWTVARLAGVQHTYSKGKRFSCIDHVIYNQAMTAYFNIASTCSFLHGISDHNPIIVSCKRGSFTNNIKRNTIKKWSTHICNTKSRDILSHNYFSVLADELKQCNNSTADEMVDKFIHTANEIGKDINAFVPSKPNGPAFHCPAYIKKLTEERIVAYKNIKPVSECPNIDVYLNQFTTYSNICNKLKKIKSKFRSNRYKANIINIGNHFLARNYRQGWRGLRNLSKPTHSVALTTVIKSKDGIDITSPEKQLERWAEHYKTLAADNTGHSLDSKYWADIFRNNHRNPKTWNINDSISLDEIRNTILSMKNNKAPGPDGIPIEFYKAIFSDPELGEKYPFAAKCLELIFNKIWDGSFPKKWNTASIVSIPKKGDLSNCNNYRGISLINVGIKIISKILTERISKYAFNHNFIRPEQFGFRNHEECISLYISIREICQRRKFQNKFTYVAFLDLKKAYDSVPIYNILTKLFHFGIRGKSFDFLSNLYLSSKARARFLDMLSDEFDINRGVRQGCPLSPILFNLFINDVLDNCDKYGVSIGGKKCCGGLFADDIVLVAPSERNMKNLLRHVFRWANCQQE